MEFQSAGSWVSGAQEKERGDRVKNLWLDANEGGEVLLPPPPFFFTDYRVPLTLTFARFVATPRPQTLTPLQGASVHFLDLAHTQAQFSAAAPREGERVHVCKTSPTRGGEEIEGKEIGARKRRREGVEAASLGLEQLELMA